MTANDGINPNTGNAWAAGDKYRLVFVSSDTTNATSTNIADYHAFIQNLANAAGHGAITWYALAATAGSAPADEETMSDAADAADPDGAFFKMDGMTIIDSSKLLFWMNKTHPGATDDIDIDETGANWAANAAKVAGSPRNGQGPVWTGSNNDGTKDARPLGTFPTTRSGKVLVDNGGQWLDAHDEAPTNPMFVYGMSEALCIQAPAVDNPIPSLSEWGLIVLGMLMLIFGVVAVTQKARVRR